MQEVAPYTPQHHIRMVTAASLFDGHDAAINIMPPIWRKHVLVPFMKPVSTGPRNMFNAQVGNATPTSHNIPS